MPIRNRRFLAHFALRSSEKYQTSDVRETKAGLAGEVADGERIAIAFVGEHELAFVIGAPQIIRSAGVGQRRALRLVAAFAAVVDQAMAIEHRVHGADRRNRDVAMEPPELLADLGCTPARSLTLELNDQLLDLERKLVSLPIRSSTAIGQSFKPAILVALEDLVAGLARNIKLAAQRRHFLAIEQTRYKAKPFVHFVTLLPRHFGLPKGLKCYLCVRNEVSPLSQEGQGALRASTA